MTPTDPVSVRVLVTRPQHQATAFIQKLQAAGAQTAEFPCIEIIYRQSLTTAEIEQAVRSNLLLFTSANAVTGAVQSKLFGHPVFSAGEYTGPTLAAIGQATYKSLQHHQLKVDLAPQENTDSEGFIDQFSESITPESTITVVRGKHGRDVLKTQLELSGAKVRYLSVYDQVLPEVNKDDARQVFLSALPCVISITSDLGLENLLRLLPPDIHHQAKACPLIVNSHRCAELARNKGFRRQIKIASPPGDNGQVAALSRL